MFEDLCNFPILTLNQQHLNCLFCNSFIKLIIQCWSNKKNQSKNNKDGIINLKNKKIK